jgi:hypothetical protein
LRPSLGRLRDALVSNLLGLRLVVPDAEGLLELASELVTAVLREATASDVQLRPRLRARSAGGGQTPEWLNKAGLQVSGWSRPGS